MTQETAQPPLLEISNLTLRYRSKAGQATILQDISTTLSKGEILGIIGESGAGKSTLGNAVIGLLGPQFELTSGSITFNGTALNGMTSHEWQSIRGRRIAAIFQDHTASLDPLMSIGAQLEETIRAADERLSRRQLRESAMTLLRNVGIPEPRQRFHDYPHQFSGGQRQRIVIAIAMAGKPDIIIADEPTSALDATVQKQILLLLRKLVDETDVSIMLVTHDMGVIAEIADKVLVMRHGRVVEQNAASAILDAPQDDYTCKLLSAVPLLRVSGLAENREPGFVDREAMSARFVKPGEADILIARDISKTFHTGGLPWPFANGASHQALNDISVKLRRGSVSGIVGESGSGKTTIGRIIAGLETASSGKITIGGMDFDASQPGRKTGLLGRVQMIFQDPAMSLNPRRTIGDTLEEAIRFSASSGPHGTWPSLDQTLDRIGIAHSFLSRYPHQLSGGQKQRVCIARALLARPEIIVADEPTSALDVSVQAEIVSLLKESVVERGISMLFISHDLALVQQICSSVYIFRNGRVEDAGPTDVVFSESANAYTRSLIEARSMRFMH